MIGIDTNILTRTFLEDDEIQGKADLADYMIIAEGEVNSANKFITFDKDIVREVKNASYP
ncbi:MAG: hypothetical protein AB8U82_01060 [Rickettsia endosymbiont of Haemaphysalis japonica]